MSSQILHYTLSREQQKELGELLGDPECKIDPYLYRGKIHIVLDETTDRFFGNFPEEFQDKLLRYIEKA